MADREHGCVEAMVDWLGIPWTSDQTDRLRTYAEWLVGEGITMGGLGPGEAGRVWPRHICDSLTFGRGLLAGSTVLDVGSGVGLPGIPLAVAFPRARVTVLDRSGRRCDALQRIVRHVGVDVEVVHQDVTQWQQEVDRLVFRASLRLAPALSETQRLLGDGGEAWFALGRGQAPRALHDWRTSRRGTKAPELEIDEVFVPPEVLDSGAWLLRIARA